MNQSFKMNRRESLVSEIAWAQGVHEGFTMAMRQISMRASQALIELDEKENPAPPPKTNGAIHPSMQEPS